MRHTERAIISSSSVRITRTATRPASDEISGPFSILQDSNNSMPRKPSPVTEQPDRLGSARVGVLQREEFLHVRTDFGRAQKAGLMVHESVELLRRHALGAAQVCD